MAYAELFNDSYERNILNNGEEFFGLFYRIFLSQSTKAKAAFEKVDMEKQQQMMKASVMVLVSFHSTGHADEGIRQLSRIHNNRHISPDLYQAWMDSLINTLERSDPLHTDEHALAWQKTLAPGIQFMKTAASSYVA